MLERLPRARRNAILVALGALVLWFLWTIRAVVNPLLLGYLLAFILHPAVARLQARGLSRRAAVNAIFVAGFLGMALAAAGVGLQTVHLVRSVAENPELLQRMEERVGEVHARIEGWLGEEYVPDLDPGSLVAAARELLAGDEPAVQAAGKASLAAAGTALGFVGGWLGAIAGAIGALLLIPLYTWFLLFELERIHAACRRFLPARDRERLAGVASQIGVVIASFFRGRLGVCALKGTFLWLGLLAAGMPYSFLFGMGSGFLSLVPFVGPMVGFVGALAIGVLEHGFVSALLRAGIVFGLGELVEGYVLIPKILGDSLGLHPVVVLFVLLAGGAALGMLGVLIALPLAASLWIVFRELVLPAVQKSVDEAEAPG